MLRHVLELDVPTKSAAKSVTTQIEVTVERDDQRHALRVVEFQLSFSKTGIPNRGADALRTSTVLLPTNHQHAEGVDTCLYENNVLLLTYNMAGRG